MGVAGRRRCGRPGEYGREKGQVGVTGRRCGREEGQVGVAGRRCGREEEEEVWQAGMSGHCRLSGAIPCPHPVFCYD